MALNKVNTQMFGLSKFAVHCVSAHGSGTMPECTVWISSFLTKRLKIWKKSHYIQVWPVASQHPFGRLLSESIVNLLFADEVSLYIVKGQLTVLSRNWKLQVLDAWDFLFKSCEGAKKGNKIVLFEPWWSEFAFWSAEREVANFSQEPEMGMISVVEATWDCWTVKPKC